jgi:polyphosphate kinase
VNSLYLNRELSWLEFNRRVLSLASEESVPLLERIKFVAIFSSNLDEFFQVRVGALQDQQEARVASRSFDGLTASEQLEKIWQVVGQLTIERDAVLADLTIKLSNEGITLCERGDTTPTEELFLDEYFEKQVLPILTPLAVDPAHPFPYISNLALNIGVLVTDVTTGEERFARLKVPTTLNRFIAVGNQRFVRVEDVITARLSTLFQGMRVSDGHVFRVTRNTDLTIDADEAEDLLAAVEMELRTQRFGNAVRIEAHQGIDRRVLDFIVEELELDTIDVYLHDGLINGSDLWEIHRISTEHLHDEYWPSVTAGRLAAALEKGESFFSVLRHRELMVHHPYEDFSTSTEEFIRQAANDPKVRAIKATLYRTSANSPIAQSLIFAAERGVQVVALIELTARFDEQTNVQWARELERAGAHVVYGMVGLKTHAKCLLVVREEETGLRRYAHIGTGNYNSTTARVYEDIGLFTCDEDTTEDVANLFNYLTGFSQSPDFHRIVTAPRDLRPLLLEKIRHEAEFGVGGSISMKMNSLGDPEIIAALVDAADKGVKIDLLVRGICTLNLASVSNSNIRVRSILGRFLEHSRIYKFGHGADDKGSSYFIGSADIMKRNLDLRVEVLTLVRHQKHQAWLEKVLSIMWRQDVVSFDMDATGQWIRRGPDDFVAQNDAQGLLMKWATELQESATEKSGFDLDDSLDVNGQTRNRATVRNWLFRSH